MLSVQDDLIIFMYIAALTGVYFINDMFQIMYAIFRRKKLRLFTSEKIMNFISAVIGLLWIYRHCKNGLSYHNFVILRA